MSLMLSTKLPSFKSSNLKQITSQRTKRNVFLVPQNSKKSAPLCLIRALLLFASEFLFQPTQNAEFQFLFVACQLHNKCSTNRSEAGKKHHSSCLCLATKVQRTTMRNFLFYSFVPCLTCPMFFFIIPCFLQPFSLVHLFLQKRKRIQNKACTHPHRHLESHLNNGPKNTRPFTRFFKSLCNPFASDSLQRRKLCTLFDMRRVLLGFFVFLSYSFLYLLLAGRNIETLLP